MDNEITLEDIALEFLKELEENGTIDVITERGQELFWKLYNALDNAGYLVEEVEEVIPQNAIPHQAPRSSQIYRAY